MTESRTVQLAAALLLGGMAAGLDGRALAQPTLAPGVRNFVKVDAPVIVLNHVRVIDGTGVPPRDDQTLVIEAGAIRSIQPAAEAKPPAGAKVLELAGYSVIPGLVGMHDHLYYPQGRGVLAPHLFSYPRLYLAAGVTTIRTTGTLEPDADIELKKRIDQGKEPGPKIHVTGPYIEGEGAQLVQMRQLAGPHEVKRLVDFWVERGVTSFKAYMHVTRAELATAIAAAHKHGLKVTGHLCAVGFTEAAELGIDNLEHGLLADSEFVFGKKPDVCPETKERDDSIVNLDLNSPPVQAMIRKLVERRVAVTSTLPVYELQLPGRPPLEMRVLDAMSAPAQVTYLRVRERYAVDTSGRHAARFKKELEFERAFVKAGGLLIAGVDPVLVLAGYGDQREVELLVEAGFTPVEAIHIATANGAQFLSELERIGTIAPGKRADVVVVHGDPSANIADIEKVEIVFKDGVGYDSAKLIESVRGAVGIY